MNNGLPGPSTTDTVTGGKTLELSEYDKVRVPHKVRDDGTMIKISVRTLSTELCCPICLDLLTSTMTTKECLHRFCAECITTALMRGNKECPTCRKKLVSKRSLRPDPNFDQLINKIWPDRKKYEEMQAESMRQYHEQTSVEALQRSIEVGMRAQEVNRRKRVQGSYDYEKRKRRPKQTPTAAANAASSSTAEHEEGLAMENGATPSATHALANGGIVEPNVTSESVAESEESDSSSDDSSTTTGENSDEGQSSEPENSDPNNEDYDNEDGASTNEMLSGDEKSQSGGRSSSLRSSSLDYHPSTSSAARGKQNRGRNVAGAHTRGYGGRNSSPKSTPKRSHRRSEGQAHHTSAASASAVPKPPSIVYDKMGTWLSEHHAVGRYGTRKSSSAADDDSNRGTSSSNAAESRLAEMRKRGEEIEAELMPAKSLLRRMEDARQTENSEGNVGGEVLTHSRFITAPPDTTMAHLGQFLHQLKEEEEKRHPRGNGESLTEGDKSNAVAKQVVSFYFHILDHNGEIRLLGSSDTLYTAFLYSRLPRITVEDEHAGDGPAAHLMLFFNTAPVGDDLNKIEELIGAELLAKFQLRKEIVEHRKEKECSEEVGEDKFDVTTMGENSQKAKSSPPPQQQQSTEGKPAESEMEK